VGSSQADCLCLNASLMIPSTSMNVNMTTIKLNLTQTILKIKFVNLKQQEKSIKVKTKEYTKSQLHPDHTLVLSLESTNELVRIILKVEK